MVDMRDKSVLRLRAEIAGAQFGPRVWIRERRQVLTQGEAGLCSSPRSASNKDLRMNDRW